MPRRRRFAQAHDARAAHGSVSSLSACLCPAAPKRGEQCVARPSVALCDIFNSTERERAPVRGYSEMFRLRTWSAKTPLRAKRRYLSGSRVKTHYRKKIIKLKSNEAIARFSSPHAICTPRVDIFHTSASHAHISTVHKTVFPDG